MLLEDHRIDDEIAMHIICVIFPTAVTATWVAFSVTVAFTVMMPLQNFIVAALLWSTTSSHISCHCYDVLQ